MKSADIAGAEGQARRAEAAGWDGITLTDSQNLAPDPFVAMTLAARVTERLRFGTGVTNASTRHPAALATVAASVQEASGGRVVLGIGRGDTALVHLGRKPMPFAPFAQRLTELQTYLAGGIVDIDGFASRIHWLDRACEPKVPIDVAASGPRVIALAARVAERITFGVGAEPARLACALDLARRAAGEAGRGPGELSFGAFVNVGCHPDPATARDLIRGGVAAFARFSGLGGPAGGAQQHHDPAFIDRFGVVGPPERCAERLHELAALGIDRFVLVGASFGVDSAPGRLASHLITGELLPALRGPDRTVT
jgi:5,10-methylenetetrahydromethanopterin reductase